MFIAGYLTAASGLGECARLMIDSYDRQGIEVYGLDLSRFFRQDREVANFSFVEGRKHRGGGTLILHVNSPLVPLALCALGRAFLQGKWRIGYWAWELPNLPPEWHAGSKFVNEIWSLSRFSADAITRGMGRSVQVVLPAVSPRTAEQDGTKPYRRQTGAGFVVLVVFNMASSFARKNPLAAIAAFKLAFGSDPEALLLVKVTNGDLYRAGLQALYDATHDQANIKLLLDTLPDQGLTDLISGADAVLSLHRSEGFGLVLAHAMHLGRPIVATNWSGNLDFLTAKNACLVAATMVKVKDPQDTYQWANSMWADPSITEAANFLRRLRSDAAFGKALGENARRDAARLFQDRGLPAFAG